ncbi:MAG: AraC family transcriptional regulator [Cyclobacterium sp.]|uniref:helix-turn-helix domain-containing protein n=1 Tax=unclassified Cyclobacterium TaxID=2615055 RepID=UPI0013D678BE|nr:AraC family transcriptional regulator [Cyclobacterium sp. SYSU L10401]
MQYIFLDSHPFLRTDNKSMGINPNKLSFLGKADRAILEHLEEEDFSVNHLADAVCLSRSQVHRKIKTMTGYSASIYIRMIRLKKAKELLTIEELTISEIAYRVGFKSPAYFSQIFKKTFGKSPTASRS